MSDAADARELLKNTLLRLPGKPCYHVRFGGSTGTSFHLSIGKRVRIHPTIPSSPLLRKLYLKATAAERYFRPEFGLMVWSSWRLSTEERMLTSSWVETIAALAPLRKLNGARIARATLGSRLCDLRIDFSNCLRLDMFGDRGPLVPTRDPRPGELSNWDLFSVEDLVVGV